MPRTEGDSPIEPRLDDRVLEVLLESSGRIAFGGLRRTLQVHPESLSRALRRLERDGLIRRSHGVYELSAPREPISRPSSAVATRTLAVAALPPEASREEIFGRLAGRWFGPLRWVGLFDRPDDPWLVWSVGDSSTQVMLSVRQGKLRVLTQKGVPRPARETVLAAYSLLGHAVGGPAEPPRTESTGTAFRIADPAIPFAN